MSALKRAKDILNEDEEVYKVTQEVLDKLMSRGMDAAYQLNAPEEVKDDMLIEWKGGNCRVCEKPYKKVRAANEFADFEYHRPTCSCLLSEEEGEDKRRAFSTKLLMAGIPRNMIGCEFENWDYGIEDQTNTAMKIVYEYVKTAKFTEEGLVLYGQVGTGKTHCAVAALKAIAGAGCSVHFCKMSGLVKKLIDKQATTYIDQLMRTDYVLFDDLDKVSTYKSEWVKDQVFNIFDRRTGKGSKFLATTNLADPKEFVAKFGEATTSRLLGAAQFVQFEGGDYRQKGIGK